MSKNFDAVSRRAGRAAVVVGFCAAAVLFSITYFASTIPSDAAICERTCAEDGKRGELAYKYKGTDRWNEGAGAHRMSLQTVAYNFFAP